MGGLFSAPAPPQPAVIQSPAAPAPTPKVDTGANIALGTDALAALNERASKPTTTAKKTTGTTGGTTGLGGLNLV